VVTPSPGGSGATVGDVDTGSRVPAPGTGRVPREATPVVRSGRPGEGSSLKGPQGTAVVSGFSPATQGPSQGTILIEGTGMTFLPMVYVGETRLVKLHNDAQMVLVALPEVNEAITGDLALDDLTPGGPNRVVLASGFRVLPRKELPVVAEFVELDPALGNLPHAINRYTVRFKNVAGQYLRPSSFSTNSNLLEAREPVFGGRVVNEGNRIRFFGGEFTLSFSGKSYSPLSSLDITLPHGAKLTEDQERGFGVRASATLPASVAKKDYEVTNTADLDEYFQWLRTAAFGITEGKSEMPLGRSVEVGKLNLDGDTGFRITSGPVGTNGKWRSAPLLMNEGWFVKRVEWSVVQTKPAGDTAKAYVRVHTGAGTFNRAPDQFLHADMNEVWPVAGEDETNHNLMMRFDEALHMNDGRVFEDVGKDPFEWFFRPILIELKADMTLVNDHDVTIRLEKVVFNGPSGKRWQDAIKRLILNDNINFLIGDGYNEYSQSTLRVFQPSDQRY
jgi:hypothetical protein